MHLRLILLFLSSASIALAQPIDARSDLLYPVNPPRKVFPQRGAESTFRIVPMPPLVGTTPSSDAFLRAYKKYQEGEKLKSIQKTEEATYCFAEALSELIALQKSDEDFQPRIVQYRVNKTLEQLSGLIAQQQ